ncbi:MAG: hypothetical protein JWP02_178 [Acidimicrobiales bacterium]|nr:hypothetical protein [Acidimicrobiales bacterium]
MLRRLSAAVAAGAALVVLVAPAADAHTVTGVSPTNYQSRLLEVTPALSGVRVRLLDLGNRIEVVNDSGRPVVVLGYQGEPYLSVGPAGTFENQRSPSTYLNRTSAGQSTSTTLPRQADASAPPSWRRISHAHTARWRDRRTRWADPAPPAVSLDPGRSHVVSQWVIGMRRGAQTAEVAGRITYVPGRSPVPWLALAVVLFAATAALGMLRRWGLALSAVLAVVIAVDVVHSFGIAAATHDPVLTQVVRVVLGGIVATMGWIIGAVAIGSLQDERESGLVGATLAGFVLAVFSGLGDIGTLTHSQVPYAFSAGAARAAVTITLGAGVGLVAAALLVFRRHPELRTTDPSTPT